MNVKKLFRRSMIATAVATAALSTAPIFASDDDEQKGKKITFIHTGDFHGDYHPHTNGRGDASGRLEGGLARAVTVIKDIRDDEDNVIHVHTGDTIHGSGEASITKGMALIELVDQLGIDVSAPGNWEWAYTPYRYMQFFGVHNNDAGVKNDDGTNIGINATFDPTVYKAVKYSAAEAGDVKSFGTPFRAVRYVESYNADGSANMATGYNRWGMVAANAYVNGTKGLDHGTANPGVGMNITPPYRVIERDGVKIGFIGCTTNRGPQVVSSTITTGVSFSNCKGGIKFPQNRPIDWDDKDTAYGGKGKAGGIADANVMAGNRNDPKNADGNWNDVDWVTKPHWGGKAGYKVVNEIEKWTNHLRKPVADGGEGVDLVAVMSEAGIAENVQAAEQLTGMTNGPDIYFSSDMHEETNVPVVTTDPRGKKVIIIENPEDIAQISQLEIEVKDGRIVEWKYKDIDVDDRIPEDRDMADLVDEIDQDIADAIDAGTATNPYNGAVIPAQLTASVGETDDIVLERNRFTNEHDPDNNIMPGVIEGTGHALVTDVFRKFTKADVGGLRGFRYTNSVLDGDDITYKSLYHFFPIGAQIAVGSIPTTPTAETGGAFKDASDATKFKHGGGNPAHYISFPRSLQQEMELGMNSSHNPNVPAWGGGWSWQYSGIKWNAQPAGPQFDKWGTMPNARISNITYYDNLNGKADGSAISDTHKATVKYASYYYHEDFNRINRNQLVTKGKCVAKGHGGLNKACVQAEGDIEILVKESSTGRYTMVKVAEYDENVAGAERLSNKQVPASTTGRLQVLDAVEVLGRYISTDGDIPVYNWNATTNQTDDDDIRHTVEGLGGEVDGDEEDFVYPRATLLMADGSVGNDLTDCTVEFGFPCIQPLRGSEAALVDPDGDGPLKANIPSLPYTNGTVDTPASEGKF